MADATHELRSPIAALRLQAGNLHGVPMPPEARERLVALEQGIVRTQSLLDQLLSFARSQAGVQGEKQRVHVVDVAKEVMAELMPSADAKAIDLGAGKLNGQAIVFGSRFDVATVLRNAIGNALKYSPAGSAVTVTILCDGKEMLLGVEDQGPGIPEGELDRVFDPFYRVLGTGEIGSGLGLAIVASIAARHGARATVRNAGESSGLVFEYRQATCSPVDSDDKEMS